MKTFAIGSALVLLGAGLAAVNVTFHDPATSATRDAALETAGASLLGEIRFDDAAGDANEYGTGYAIGLASCIAGYVVGGDCIDAPVPAVGTPGPQFDILGYGLARETETDIVVFLEVAQLSEDLAELATPDGLHRMVWYEVCWASDADGGCDRVASLQVMLHDGAPHTEATFMIFTEGCNEWWWCAFSIEPTITYGAPARIELAVPKDHAVADGAPLAMHHVEAFSGWYTEAQVFPMWHAGVTAHVPAYHFHTHGPPVGAWSGTDSTARGAVDAHFAPAPGGRELFTGPALPAGPGANHGAGSPYDEPELDLLGVDLYEEGENLVVAFAVAEYNGAPDFGLDYSIAVGTEDWVYEIGFRSEGGEQYGYAGHCIMEPCQDTFVMHAETRVTEGAPALIEVLVPLEVIGDPAPGTSTSLLWSMSMWTEGSVYWGEEGSELFGDVHHAFMVDMLMGGHPYVFGSGHRGGLTAAAHQH